jgi:hypothetical protein
MKKHYTTEDSPKRNIAAMLVAAAVAVLVTVPIAGALGPDRADVSVNALIDELIAERLRANANLTLANSPNGLTAAAVPADCSVPTLTADQTGSAGGSGGATSQTRNFGLASIGNTSSSSNRGGVNGNTNSTNQDGIGNVALVDLADIAVSDSVNNNEVLSNNDG